MQLNHLNSWIRYWLNNISLYSNKASFYSNMDQNNSSRNFNNVYIQLINYFILPTYFKNEKEIKLFEIIYVIIPEFSFLGCLDI